MSETLTHPDEGTAFASEQDAALRHWTHATPGPIKIGSDEHRKMFCRMPLDTHDTYRPAVLDWPKLEPDALGRLTSLPIWDIAVQTNAHDSNFPPANREVLGDSLEPRELIELRLAENDARMSGYDARLLRPMFVPALARFALRLLKKSRHTVSHVVGMAAAWPHEENAA